MLERVSKSIHNRVQVGAARTRGTWLRLTYGFAWSCGHGLMAGPGAEIQSYGRLRIGNNVRISAGCLLNAGPGGELEIGDDVFIGRNTVIVAVGSIIIGAQADIAEHCTIRDADHHLTAGGRARGEVSQSSVVIGAGCWIGAGARVLRGSRLGEGVVVGANAVVRGEFAPQTVIAGVPARVINSLKSGPP